MEKTLTRAQSKLYGTVRDKGEAWIVPSQYRVARYLQHLGLLRITEETRPNTLRGNTERRVVRVRPAGGER